MFTHFARTGLLPAATAFLTLCSGGYSQAAIVPYTPDADTVVLYHFDDATDSLTATDAAGNFDVSASSSPFAGVAGPGGLATAGGTFDAPSRLLTHPNLSQAEVDLFNTETFTIEAWIYNLDTSYVPGGVFQYRNGNNSRLSLRFDTGKIGIGIQRMDTGNFHLIQTTNPLVWEEDTWYHVAVTYEGDGTGNDSLVNFYRTAPDDPLYVANLIETLTGVPDINPLTPGSRLHIGGNDGNSTRMFGDYIDELRFSNVVRTEFNVFVPEPSSGLLAALGMVGLVLLGHRRPRGVTRAVA